MARYYPIYLDLTGKTCLVVGGGAVAARRAQGLLEAGATVRIISPTLTPDLQSLLAQQAIQYHPGLYEPSSLQDVVLVVAATNSRAVNAQVVNDARIRRIPVNAADAPEEGDYIVPSIVRRGEFCLSISTGGANPMLAARLAHEMEARFGPEYADYMELLAQMRLYIKNKTEAVALRRRALAALLDAEPLILERLRADSGEAARTIATETVDAVLGA